jgi:hypothetical protein
MDFEVKILKTVFVPEEGRHGGTNARALHSVHCFARFMCVSNIPFLC